MKNYSKLLEAMLSGEYVTVKEKGVFEDNEVKILNIDHTEEVEVEDWTGGTTILHIDDLDLNPKKLWEYIIEEMGEEQFNTVIEKYYPNYTSSDEILHSDIMWKSLNNEELDHKDLNWIDDFGSREDLVEAYRNLMSVIWEKTENAYFEKQQETFPDYHGDETVDEIYVIDKKLNGDDLSDNEENWVNGIIDLLERKANLITQLIQKTEQISELEEDGEYYLFGEQVCNIYDDGDFTKVEDFAKEEGGASVGYHKFIDAITLLDEYDGYAGFRKITKEEYIRVYNALEN